MRAARYHDVGDVRVESVPDAPPPRHDEVRLEVLRAAICGTDASEYAYGPLQIPIHFEHPGNGRRGPVTLGHEFVGRIESIGSGVEGLSVGQRVVPGAGVWCGSCEWCLAGRTNLCARYYTHGLQADGGLAEYATVPARTCRAVPDCIGDDAASVAQPLAVALHAVRRGKPAPGQVAVLIGVGGIGHFALAALADAAPSALVAVDVDRDRLAHARATGASHVVDPSNSDPIALVRELTGGLGAHLVIEASGAPPSPALAIELVRRGGTIVLVGLQAAPCKLDLASLVLNEVTVVTTVAHVCDEDLPKALDLLRDAALGEEAIDRVIPLEAVVTDGLIPLVERNVRGKIVVRPR